MTEPEARITLAKVAKTDDLRDAVIRMLTAQGRMLDGWAEANAIRRNRLWCDLHETADVVRDALDQTDCPGPKPSLWQRICDCLVIAYWVAVVSIVTVIGIALEITR